jgi:hypothetical protein
MVFTYLTHGIALRLPFLCEELGAPAPDLPPDLCVAAAEVPRQLVGAELREPLYDTSSEAFLYRGGMRSARFLATRGESIVFQKNARCEEALFLHHLLHPVTVAALWQRGLFVLHASSVVSPKGAILVTGESGAGKSTTVARLMAEGWPLHTDDVSALCPNHHGILQVQAGARHVHLHEASAAQLGIGTQGLARHDWHRMKMAIPASVSTERHACTIAMIVYLFHADTLSVEAVRGRDKLPLLLRSVYGPVLREMAVMRYDLLSRALSEIEMIAIGRPAGQWTAEEIVRAICRG